MLQTKAIYNLMRLNAAEDPTLKPESWAIEDLRKIPQQKLFARLVKAGIQLGEGTFLQYAEQCDTPEELADLLLPEEAEDKQWDSLYLVIFEVWRRLLPNKQSLSIFCDELDFQIALYDQGKLENDEPIQDGLANLLEILDENADAGGNPQDIFKAVSDYCAYDLESFLHDYISDLLDSKNQLYASELVDGFFPYVLDPIWFDFLRARLLSFSDIGEANRIIHGILEKADEPLLMEILRFLAVNGEHELFLAATNQILPLLNTEEEFLEVMETAADYYRRLDEDGLEQSIQKLMKKRKNPQEEKLNPKDPDLKTLQSIIMGSKRI